MSGQPPPPGRGAVRRLLVATDRSPTAQRAVDWAAELANRYGAELVLLQVLPRLGTAAGAPEDRVAALMALRDHAAQVAGPRGIARVVEHEDPAAAIVEAAEAEDVDLVVVGNVGMSDRKRFLLGNVPNRVSHSARCSVVIVNTAGPADEAERPRARPDGDGEPHLLRRATRIARVVAGHGLGELLDVEAGGAAARRERARRLRAALEELGPTFAKLGQVLSTRPDLLPSEFVEELAALQDRVTPLSEEEVVNVLEQELGVPWEDVFERVEPEPLASGTIGQVHRAVLEGGERVVIKVQRPTARDEILHDLGLLELFAEQVRDRPSFRQLVDVPAALEHLSESLRRELDFGQEAASIERMRAVLAPYERLGVPRLFPELSTARLLVMEEVEGVPLRLAPEGEARREAARELLDAYYRQILREGFFHADPHPGNLLWWHDRIYFLDFGMVGEVSSDLRGLVLMLVLAFWREDPRFLAEVVVMIAGDDAPRNVDMAALERDLGAFLATIRGASITELQLGPVLEGVTAVAANHGLPLPSSLALAGKALAQMQGTAAELDPELDPFAAVGGFLVRSLRDQARDLADPQTLFYEARKLGMRVARFIDSVEHVTGAKPGGKLVVDFHATDPIEEAIRKGTRQVAAALVAGGALVAAALWRRR